MDDEKLIVDTNTRALKRLGYTVRGVNRPDEAWKILSSDSKEWDLVITDMTMPGMTGDILAEKIHTLNPEIPVLICTGYADLVAEGSPELPGSTAILHKSVSLELLAERVRTMLDGRRGLS